MMMKREVDKCKAGRPEHVTARRSALTPPDVPQLKIRIYIDVNGKVLVLNYSALISVALIENGSFNRNKTRECFINKLFPLVLDGF